MSEEPPNLKPIVVNGVRPLVLSKKLLIQVLGSVKLVQRMLYATRHGLAPEPWLRIVRMGRPGCELLVDTSSVEQAYARLLAGEEPPRLPSEPPERARASSLKIEPKETHLHAEQKPGGENPLLAKDAERNRSTATAGSDSLPTL